MRRKRMLEGLEKDIREHIERETRENRERGMSPDEARYAALRKFGNRTQVHEDTWEVWTFVWFELLLRDIRFSFRMMRKNPGFTVAAVLTLALAIGANAVVFSILNAVLLRPLDVEQPAALYTIDHARDKFLAMSYPDYVDLRDRNRSFDGVAAYSGSQVGLDTGRRPARVFADEVSGNYFDVFGIQPYLGRFMHAADERGPNSAPYIVLNFAFWQSHFQGDRSVIGRKVQLNKYPFTIIGVAPPKFHGPVVFFSQDIFVPLIDQEQVEGRNTLNARGNPSLFMTVARLKAGVGLQQAVGELNSIGSYLEKTYPTTDGKLRFGLARPNLFGDFAGPPTRAFLTALMSLSGLILLAACANLGSLFAARAYDREGEIAMRLALGASRKRILRGLFAEALLLSILGGVIGVCGGAALLRALSAWQPVPRFPFQLAVHADANVYIVALVLALISGFLFGAAPVRQVLRTDPYPIVKSGLRSKRGGRLTARDCLLVVQIAICALLITASMVAVRGLVRSLNGHFGFEPQNAVLMDTELAMAGYQGRAVPAMQKRMIERMQASPGMTAVALADRLPLDGTLRRSRVFAEETADLRAPNAAAYAPTYAVSPGYFRAAGTPLASGRSFSWHDDANAPRVAVVNQEFAREVFRTTSKVLGRAFKLEDGSRVQVVGTVADGKYQRIGEEQEPAMFLPLLQEPSSATTMVLRSTLEPAQVIKAAEQRLHSLDSGLPCFLQSWNKALGVALFAPRMATIALGVLGGMGAMLSVTGIFGIAAYSVSRRMKEFGIRLALGAQRRDVLRAALGRALQLLAIGSVAGLCLGVLASRVLAAMVYQATTRDPVVLAGVVFCMGILGLVATWVPAQRALSVNPLALLREE